MGRQGKGRRFAKGSWEGFFDEAFHALQVATTTTKIAGCHDERDGTRHQAGASRVKCELAKRGCKVESIHT